jgi:hypothetical protein
MGKIFNDKQTQQAAMTEETKVLSALFCQGGLWQDLESKPRATKVITAKAPFGSRCDQPL